MIQRSYFSVILCFFAELGFVAATYAAPPAQPAPERFVLDMVHHNPGEPRLATKWTDPAFLRQAGYNGQVPRWFVQCAVNFEAFDPSLLPVGSLARTWIDTEAARIERDLAAATAAGLPVYPFTDFLVVPRTLLEKYGREMCGPDGKPDINRPVTQAVVRAQIAAIFERFPQLAGLTLRFGETYLHDTPHHVGARPMPFTGDEAIRGHIALVNLLREEICVKRERMLFYRTWDFGQFHDRPDFYLAVTDAVEPHPRLVFSIKHQRGDFHRLSVFNPTLGLGRHRQLVEVQGQAEAYGKGAHPFYVGRGVIDGWEEYAWTMRDTAAGRPRGLRDFWKNPLCAGVWTWARGGGWDGPVITDELWCDASTRVVSQFALHPERSEEELLAGFCHDVLGLDDADAARFRELSLLSASAVLRGQLSVHGDVNVWWARDQYLDAPDLGDIVRRGRVEEAVAEKAEAVRQWRRIETLAAEIRFPDPGRDEFAAVSASYGRIKYAIIAAAWTVILRGAQLDALAPAAEPVRRAELEAKIAAAIADYDAHWVEWRALAEAHPVACPTLYRDVNSPHSGAPALRSAIDLRRVARSDE